MHDSVENIPISVPKITSIDITIYDPVYQEGQGSLSARQILKMWQYQMESSGIITKSLA